MVKPSQIASQDVRCDPGENRSRSQGRHGHLPGVKTDLDFWDDLDPTWWFVVLDPSHMIVDGVRLRWWCFRQFTADWIRLDSCLRIPPSPWWTAAKPKPWASKGQRRRARRMVSSFNGWKKVCNGVADLIFQYACPLMIEQLKGKERYQ